MAKVIKGSFVIVLALLSVMTVRAADEPCDMPNPFAPSVVHTESRGAKWRHFFHDARTTITERYKVYDEELDNCEDTTFEKIKADPAYFLDRKVQFDIYYSKIGSFYKPFVTPFIQETFVNFSAWGYGSELWLKDARMGILPLYYIDKGRKKLIDKIQHLPAYTPLHVCATVRSKTDGLPWFELLGAEIIPEAVLSTESLRHIEMGVSQLNKKRFDLSTTAFEAALAMELPVAAESKVYSYLGRAYTEQRSFNSARNALCNAVLRDPKNVDALILLARADLRVDKAEEAKQAAEAAISIEPANPLAHAELGLALALLNDIRAGYRELDVAQKLARNQLPEANRNRAVIAMREGKLTVAENELKQAVLFRPTDVDLKVELGDVYMAMGKPEDMEKARGEYTQARDLALHRPEPFYKLALMLKKQGDMLKKDGKEEPAKKAYEEALENAKNAIQRDDQFTPAYGLQAEILRALGRPEDAQKVLEGGVKIKGNLPKMQEYLYQQALVLGDYKVMEETVRNMLGRKPTAELYSRLGNVLAGKPEPDMHGAAEAFESAVQLSADRQKDWSMLGHIRLQYLGDVSGAQQALRLAVKLDPKDGAAMKELAVASRGLGDTDEAIKAADEAIALNNSVQARIIGALARLDKGGDADVAAAAELATKAQPDAATDVDKAWTTAIQGAVALKAGKNDEAIDFFTKSDALASVSPEYNLWYGQALLNAGVAAGAQEHLRSAMNLTQTRLKSSGLAARINNDAANALKNADAIARNQGKPDKTEVKTTKIEEPKKGEPVKTAKKEAPVIEEPDGKTTPVKVPRP